MKYLLLTVLAAVGIGAFLLAPKKERESAVAAPSHPAESLWLTDYKEAEQKAKTTNKPLLLEFTGSDWCPPCRQLQQQILSTPEFEEYAKSNFVLVELDYPRSKVQSPEIAQQNLTLARRFRIEVFPTVIILSSDGKKLGELIGFDPRSGPEGYIASIEKFRKG